MEIIEPLNGKVKDETTPLQFYKSVWSKVF